MGPYFETWKHQTLVRFAKEAYEKLQRQEEELQRLRLELRERLAQPEPVAWVTGWHDGHCVIRAANPSAILPIGIALYTTPPRREWVGLTDEEKLHLEIMGGKSDVMLAETIETKLKEKNGL